MKRLRALILSGLTILLGLSLVIMGIMHERFGGELYRPVIVITLAWVFFAFLVVSCVVSRFVEDGYEPLFATMFVMLSIMSLMLGAFFGYIWLLVNAYVYSMLLKVLLICYGLAVMMVGVANQVLSGRDSRPFIYDFFRSCRIYINATGSKEVGR